MVLTFLVAPHPFSRRLLQLAFVEAKFKLLHALGARLILTGRLLEPLQPHVPFDIAVNDVSDHSHVLEAECEDCDRLQDRKSHESVFGGVRNGRQVGKNGSGAGLACLKEHVVTQTVRLHGICQSLRVESSVKQRRLGEGHSGTNHAGAVDLGFALLAAEDRVGECCAHTRNGEKSCLKQKPYLP